ncbi:citrate lyase subunit beta / citryl-CoA lyase [Nocardioides exalbidus]|uniref:Citrate lyase subunit beta / citryl-CoA lyase n=1 Tax=Nocardioides exalbidus TaxID=402596 RepID=A0A1H4R037_9ACTN|nr:CoA ester lyase [Nocardioides exalbidus]SEC25114.1 citrate lyase subunit beta / citryl-CoA lyase [Nocardioides exalbidus]
MVAARSLLYVPGDRPDRFAKAIGSGADAVILDLEDAVAAERKESARSAVGSFVADHTGECQLWVRIEPTTLALDAAAVVGPGLTGLLLPKVEPELLDELDRALTELESARGLAAGSTPVVGILETASGLQRLEDIAAHPRIRRLGIGEADLAGELGLVPDESRSVFAPIRSSVVIASAAAGLERPIGPVHTAVDDLEGLRATALQQLSQGFRARTAVHPRQVATINEVFTPGLEEVAAARAVLQAYDDSLAQGVGVLRDAAGRVMDAATVRAARETVERARA